MSTRSIHPLRTCWALLALAAACAPALGAEKSATAATAETRAAYQRELAVCNSNASNQDRATCLREAHAAYAEARRGALTGGAAQGAANALKRCEALPEADRKDCVARMQGQGTTRGSVAEGGIYRELVTREVGAPASAPASAAK